MSNRVNNFRHFASSFAAGGLLAMIAAGAGHAQNGLDANQGGNALDANLSPLGGRINAPRQQENYRDRNLIITGNVAGGRGFRGSVGYAAESDFRSNLGSNDLFQFRAGSAFSSPQLIGLGSTFEQLRFGQSLGVIEYQRGSSAAPPPLPGGIGTSRGVGASRINAGAAGMEIPDLPQLRLQADRLSLANTPGARTDSGAEPRMIGMAYSGDGRQVIIDASSIRGLSSMPADSYLQTIGLSSYDSARLIEDKMEGRAGTDRLGLPFEPQFDQTKFDQTKLDHERTVDPADPHRIDTTASDSRMTPGEPEDYRNVLKRIADRYSSLNDEGTNPGDVAPEARDSKRLRSLDETYKELQDRLAGRDETDQTRTADGEIEPRSRDERILAGDEREDKDRDDDDGGTSTDGRARRDSDRPDRPKDPNAVAGTPGAIVPDSGLGASDKDDKDDEDATERKPLTPEEYGVLLRHGEQIQTLSADSQDRFNELVRSAEEKLREGEYFWAERRFARALRFTPGHPLATAGLGHAQIGAGLHLSAALTMRDLFTSRPEMIDVTYHPRILPKPEELKAAAAAVQDRLRDEGDRAALGLLLAYLGRQLGDADLIEQGLESMKQDTPNDPLLPVLRAVWLAPVDANAPPKPKPRPAPTGDGLAEPGK